LLSLCSLRLLSGAGLPQFKDRGEYEIVGRLEGERDPIRSLVLLNHWAERYSNSAFKQERDNRLIETYQALKFGLLMFDTARHMTADDPRGLGNYWVTLLTISLQDSSQSALREGRVAAEMILRNSHTTYSKANCPNSVARSDWLAERDRQVTLAHRTLGWVALQERRFQDAEREFTTVLQSNPEDAEVDFWMGAALLGDHNDRHRAIAIDFIGRSLDVVGKTALLPEARILVKMFYGAPEKRPSFVLPVRGPEQIPAPPEAAVFYNIPGASATNSGAQPNSRGALLVKPVLENASISR
jgi:hypothetical protein